MREFVTAVEALEGEPEDGNTFTIDGREVTYYKPTDGQVAVYMASTGKRSADSDQIAGLVNFFMGVFDKDSQSWLTARLMDRDDKFSTKEMGEILEALIEEWSGRPTQSSSASTRSRTNGGRKSTPRSLVSTSSDSRSTGS